MKEEKRRIRCTGCGLLRAQCVCAYIAPIDNRTPVRVLQHPDEARHALNTARWVVAGLRAAQLMCKPAFTSQDWYVPGYEPVLLYPEDVAADQGKFACLHALLPSQSPTSCASASYSPTSCATVSHAPARCVSAFDAPARGMSASNPSPCSDSESLVVIDGTWRQAAAILRAHPELLALRRIVLPASSGSAYRLRKSPRPDGLSTVEAVVAALDLIDAPTSHAAVLRPFQAQIDQQIATQRAHMGEQAFKRNYPDV